MPLVLPGFSPSLSLSSLFFSLFTLLHSQANVYNICASGQAPNSIKSLLLPGRAHSISRCRRRSGIVQGCTLRDPHSRGPRTEKSGQTTMPIIVSQFDRGHQAGAEGAHPRSVARRFSAGGQVPLSRLVAGFLGFSFLFSIRLSRVFKARVRLRLETNI